MIRECGIELKPEERPPDEEEYSMDSEKYVMMLALAISLAQSFLT